MKKNNIRDLIAEHNEEALLMDGHDNAIIGMCHRYGQEPLVAYDLEKVFANLIKDGMTREEAVEWWEFNMVGAWVGENTPVFITKIP